MEREGYSEPNIGEEVGPNRLVRMTREWIERAGFEVHLQGEEHLREIPKDAPVIFAVSHLSDHDIPIAVDALGEHFGNLRVVDESTHYSIRENPVMFAARKIGGEENFLRVDMDGSDNQRRGLFKNENFLRMKESLKEGNPLVMAAYYDPKYAGGKWELASKAGNGAAYVSQITEGAVIVPVAVDIEGKPFAMGKADVGRLIGKPNLKGLKGEQKNAMVKIGEPISPEKIPDIDKLADVIDKRARQETITEEEKQQFKRVKRELKQQSAMIMETIANLLPEGKRGPWSPREDVEADISE